jgi:phosphatidylinositol-3-phosphatase
MLLLLGALFIVVLRSTGGGGGGTPSSSDGRAVRAAAPRAATPAVGHVFVINIENKGFRATWGAHSAAPYLAKTLRSRGVLLRQFHATAHHSLPDYIAQISGQGPSPATQADCGRYTAFRTTARAVRPQQAVGDGCVYPRQVRTVAGQLSAAGLGWRGYMEDMSRPCQHPRLGATDPWRAAQRDEQYATRHNPFVYFHSVIDHRASCSKRVVNLDRLPHDLRKGKRTPNYSFITPDLCADGHDATCADPAQPGGYAGIDDFLHTWVPRILNAPAMKKDGLLIITFDESESGAGAGGFVPSGPNAALQGITGPGGGRTGAVLISTRIKPGTVSDKPYNHYSLLRSTEDIFGLKHLGYARDPAVSPFGRDVFTRSR